MANVKVEWDNGIPEGVKKFTKKVIEALVDASEDAVDIIANESEKQVPLEYGTLRDSWEAIPLKNEIGFMIGYHCVGINEFVLLSDLTWKRAGSLKKGEKLFALSENKMNENNQSSRQVCMGEVLNNEIKKATCLKVYTDKGDIVITENHPFLAKTNVKLGYKWTEAEKLKKGDLIKFISGVWKEKGLGESWLSGMYDGEGSIGRDGQTVYIWQKSGPEAERIKRELSEMGFNFSVDIQKSENHTVENIYILGGLRENIRLLGQVRPNRLIKMWQDCLSKYKYGSKSVDKAVVLEIEDVGIQDIASLTTTPSVFISNGFVSHNTPYASRLHEHPEYNFRNGRKGKFLEDPIEQNLGDYQGKYLDKLRSILQ